MSERTVAQPPVGTSVFSSPPNGFFQGGGYGAALATLIEGIAQPGRLMLVTGPPGAGKTVLCRTLAASLPPESSVVRLNGGLLGDRNALAAALSSAAPGEPADAAVRIAAGVVLVDDADRLDGAALDYLIDLAVRSPAAVVLFGSRALERRRPLRHAARPASLVLSIEPLSEADAGDYLAWRLADAGQPAARTLSAGETASIVRRCKGIPGRIDALAAAQLEGSAGRRPGRLALWLLAAGALAAIALLGPDPGSSSDSPPLPATPTAEPAAAPTTPSIQPASPEAPRTSAPSKPEPPAAAEPVPPVDGRTSAAAVAPSDLAPSIAVEASAAIAFITIDAERLPAPKRQSETSALPGTPAEPVRPARPEPSAEPERAANAEPPADGDSADPVAWLLAQPSSNFTLQLAAVSSAERARIFVQQQQNRSQYFFYAVQQGSTRRYIILHGSYASRAAAEQAAAQLPRTAGTAEPWVRSMGEVQRIVQATAGR